MNNLKNKLWRLYTGDYTDVGYHIGETQAKQGKPKSFFGLLTNIRIGSTIYGKLVRLSPVSPKG